MKPGAEITDDSGRWIATVLFTDEVESWMWFDQAWPDRAMTIQAADLEGERDTSHVYEQLYFPERTGAFRPPRGSRLYALSRADSGERVGCLAVEDVRDPSALHWAMGAEVEGDRLDLVEGLRLEPTEGNVCLGTGWRVLSQSPL